MMNWQYEVDENDWAHWHLFSEDGVSVCGKFGLNISGPSDEPWDQSTLCPECMKVILTRMSLAPEPPAIPDLPVLMKSVDQVGDPYYVVFEEEDQVGFLDAPFKATYRQLGPALDEAQVSDLTGRLAAGTTDRQVREDRKVFDALAAKHGFTTGDGS